MLPLIESLNHIEEYQNEYNFYSGLYHAYRINIDKNTEKSDSYFNKVQLNSAYYPWSRLELYNNMILKYGLFYNYLKKYKNDSEFSNNFHEMSGLLADEFSKNLSDIDDVESERRTKMICLYLFNNRLNLKSIETIHTLMLIENKQEDINYDNEFDRKCKIMLLNIFKSNVCF